MTRPALILSLLLAAAAPAAVQAQASDVHVSIGPDLQDALERLGQRAGWRKLAARLRRNVCDHSEVI